MGEEVSSKFVLVLAIVVMLVVAVSTWMLLNKLNSLEVENKAPQPAVVYVTEKITEAPAPVGKVAMAILPPGGPK